MKKSLLYGPCKLLCIAAVFAFGGAAFSARNQTAQTPAVAAVPKVDGGVGACKANFTVRDGSNKPIYNAQILVELRYGFMNLRKTDLQVGTSNDGKAQFTGLPDFPKKPLAFTIKSGTVSKTVTDDPTVNCDSTFDVVLTVH
ncbi:MAG: hypothetical protein WBE20_03550 [Candidatus Acidiferrales bacterium]